MEKLYERIAAVPQKGADITIPEHSPAIYVSEYDEVFCYMGIRLTGGNITNKTLFMHPYTMRGLHSTDTKISRRIENFYRLADGCVILDEFLDSHFRKEHLYKRVEAGIRFPCPDTYFGIMVQGREQEELTRAVFGLTHRELSELVDAYAKILGMYNDFMQLPRLTRSMKNVNYCDLTGACIPSKFPYIAFSTDGSHVSLWGFYQHIRLLTMQSMNRPVSRALQEAGISEALLQHLFSLGGEICYQKKVTHDILDED